MITSIWPDAKVSVIDKHPYILKRLEHDFGFLRPRFHQFPHQNDFCTALFKLPRYGKNQYMRAGFYLDEPLRMHKPVALTLTGIPWTHCFDHFNSPNRFKMFSPAALTTDYTVLALSFGAKTTRKAMQGTSCFRRTLEKDKQYVE